VFVCVCARARACVCVMASDSDDGMDDAGVSVIIRSEEKLDNLEYEDESEDEQSPEEDVSSDSDDDVRNYFVGKDNTQWFHTPPHPAVYRQHNVIHVRPGLT
jgi:hypothetical protein